VLPQRSSNESSFVLTRISRKGKALLLLTSPRSLCCSLRSVTSLDSMLGSSYVSLILVNRPPLFWRRWRTSVVDPRCLSITGVPSKSDIVPCFCVFVFCRSMIVDSSFVPVLNLVITSRPCLRSFRLLCRQTSVPSMSVPQRIVLDFVLVPVTSGEVG
jgi:hypothetical protein